jgi:enhancer of polycomb-like protein
MELTHKMSNQNHLDMSLVPLSPVAESRFRAAIAPDYLITPPTSTSDAMDIDDDDDDGAAHAVVGHARAHHQQHPAVAAGHQPTNTPRYRRRIGRGGRLWVDRRNLEGRRLPEGSRTADQWRFDCDDDEDEPPVYELDPFSDAAMSWRAMVIGVPRPASQMAGRRPPPANAASVAEASANYQRAVAAAASGDDSLLRQARQHAAQHPHGGIGPPGGHTRAALVPAPMQAQNGVKQLSKMAPPVLPPAQKV